MDKNRPLWLVAVLVLGLLLLYFFKKEARQPVGLTTERLTSESVESGERHFFKNVQLQPSGDMVEKLGSSQRFERQTPTIPISLKEISLLSGKDWKVEEFEEWAASKLSQRQVLINNYQSFTEKEQWDLHQLPESHAEFKLWLNEATLHAYYKLSQSIEKKNGTNAILAAAAVDALRFISIFKFRGYDDGGQWVFSLSKEKEYVLNSLKHSRGKRMPATNQASLFSMLSETDSFSEEEKEALLSLKRDQTSYGEEISGSKARYALHTKGDVLSGKTFKFLDYLVGLTGNFGGAITSKELHIKNQEVIDDLIEDIHDRPNVYGYEESELLSSEEFNVSHVDLSLLIQRVVHNRSKTAAFWGAGLSSVFGAKISTAITSARAWSFAILTSMGIETVFMTYACYQGMRQVYVLHRYYSYMRGRRRAAEFKGQSFDLIKAKQEFSVDVKFDRHFKTDAFRSWLVALGLGIIVKSKAHRKNIEIFVRGMAVRFFRVTRNLPSKNLAPFIKVSLTGLSRFVVKILQSSTWSAFALRFFPKFPKTIKNKGANKALKIARKFSLLSPASILLTAIDFGVTSASMYSLTYLILYNSSLALTYTDPSPSMSVQLSLASIDERNEDFYRATQEILYPLCIHLSFKKKEFIYEASNLVRASRQKACLNILSALEGGTRGEISSKFPNIYDALTSEKLITLNENEFINLIKRAYEYPSHYRVVWLSALRSLYGLKHIPEVYWSLQVRLLSGPDVSLNDNLQNLSIFLRSPGENRNYMNIDRLNYAIELLAVDIERFKRQKSSSRRGRQDSSIAENIPSIENAWISYMKFYQKATRENVEVLIKERAKREDIGYLQSFGETASSFADVLSRGWKTFWSDPAEWSLPNRIRKNNGLILGSQSAVSRKTD